VSRTCGLCNHPHVFETRKGLNKHSTACHGQFYSLAGNCFVPIQAADLRVRMDKLRGAQQHRYPHGAGPRSRGGGGSDQPRPLAPSLAANPPRGPPKPSGYMVLRGVRPGRPAAVRYRPPYPPAVPVELPLPEFNAAPLPVSTGPSTSSSDGPSLLVAVTDCSAPARPPSALDTLVDLALVETTQPPNASSLNEPVGRVAESGPLTLALPTLTNSWVHVLLADPVDAAASGSTTPRLLTDPVVRTYPAPAILSPAAAVEAAAAPLPTNVVEVVTSTEALPQGATGFDPLMTDPGPSLPTDRLLPSEDELGNIFTSSEDDSVVGPAFVPPGPTMTGTRRPLQPRDVISAAHSASSRAEMRAIVPTLLSTYATNLSAADLTERLNWLRRMRRDVAARVLDVAVRGRLLHRPDERTLSEVIRLLETFAAESDSE